MLTCSTTYHRGNWGRKTRAWLRRLDHSSIFVLIAGTYTPFCMLALEDKTAQRLLVRNCGHHEELWSGGGRPRVLECSKIVSQTLHVVLRST